MHARKSTLYLFLLLSAFSCKKKDPEPPTRTQLLTSKKWQLRSDVLSYPGTSDTDVYAQLRTCSLDDYRQFNSPNTAVYNEGATKCSPLDPQEQLGLWALSDNDTKLTITDQISSDLYTIVQITDSSLKMTLLVPQSSGTDATLTLTYAVIK